MSYESPHRYHDPTRRLYRNRDCGWIMGVCAGIASFLRADVAIVRIVAVVSLMLFTWPTALIYLALGVVLKDQPLSYRGRGSEHGFWRSARHGEREYR